MNKQSQKGFVRQGFSEGGFTLIEILVVIGMIAILATIVLIAINPARQFKQSRNTQRTSNVNAILNAIGQYIADNKGSIPVAITTTEKVISKAGADLCPVLSSTYMPSHPVDPDTTPGVGSLGKGESIPKADCDDAAEDYITGYRVVQEADGRITVKAPNTELCSASPCPAGEQIKVTR